MYFILKILTILLKNIPRSAGYFLFESIAMIAFAFGGKRKQTLINNLTNVLSGNKPETSLLKQVYRNYGRYYFDLFTKREKLLNSTDTSLWPTEEIQKILSQYGSFILVTPHYGNWDHGGNFLSDLYPGKISVVAEELSADEFRWFTETRTKFGMHVIKSTDLKEMVRTIKNGNILVLVADRDLEKTGFQMDFFGKKAYIPSGPAQLATKLNVPICFAAMTRNPENKMQFTPTAEKMLNLDKKERTDENIEVLTKEMIKLFEKQISKHPEQWCMLQKIFIEP